MNKIIYYVDGDNQPGHRTEGIKLLPENTVVKVFFASNNTYYNKAGNRETITNQAKCSVEFEKVPAGSNAVDMMIAIDAATELTGDEGVQGVVLISNDNHLNMIGSFLKNRWPHIVIKNVETIKQGHEIMDFLSIGSLQEMYAVLTQKYGTKAGTETYHKIKDICGNTNNLPALPEPSGVDGWRNRLKIKMARVVGNQLSS